MDAHGRASSDPLGWSCTRSPRPRPSTLLCSGSGDADAQRVCPRRLAFSMKRSTYVWSPPENGVDSMVCAPTAVMLAVAWYCPDAPLPYQVAGVRNPAVPPRWPPIRKTGSPSQRTA
jgi:hypothetical protein